MIDERQILRSLADQVLLCREKRAVVAKELAQYIDGTLSVGTPEPGETMTLGTRTHILFLEREIEQLDRIINSFSPPTMSVSKVGNAAPTRSAGSMSRKAKEAATGFLDGYAGEPSKSG
jgi:hypothetical protein